LKRSKENLKNHLALVEALRLEDLKILQKSAEILCNLNMATTWPMWSCDSCGW